MKLLIHAGIKVNPFCGKPVIEVAAVDFGQRRSIAITYLRRIVPWRSLRNSLDISIHNPRRHITHTHTYIYIYNRKVTHTDVSRNRVWQLISPTPNQINITRYTTMMSMHVCIVTLYLIKGVGNVTLNCCSSVSNVNDLWHAENAYYFYS